MRLLALGLGALFLSACASVPLESPEKSAQAKQFSAPEPGQSGLYVFRDNSFGGALKKSLWVDGECLGESAPYVFFLTQVEGDKEHTISTESEFSPNDFTFYAEEGKNYYLRQYIKLGVFVGGANVEQVSEAKAQAAIADLDLAKPGNCR